MSIFTVHKRPKWRQITVGKIDHKLTQLAEIVNSFAPVVKELKSAYDAIAFVLCFIAFFAVYISTYSVTIVTTLN